MVQWLSWRLGKCVGDGQVGETGVDAVDPLLLGGTDRCPMFVENEVVLWRGVVEGGAAAGDERREHGEGGEVVVVDRVLAGELDDADGEVGPT